MTCLFLSILFAVRESGKRLYLSSVVAASSKLATLPQSKEESLAHVPNSRCKTQICVQMWW